MKRTALPVPLSPYRQRQRLHPLFAAAYPQQSHVHGGHLVVLDIGNPQYHVLVRLASQPDSIECHE